MVEDYPLPVLSARILFIKIAVVGKEIHAEVEVQLAYLDH